MTLAAYPSADDALTDLSSSLFDGEGGALRGRMIAAEQLPPGARRLLDHRGHMTAVLADYWGQMPALRVLAERFEEETYRRKILLSLPEGGRMVELGVVRLDLACVNDEVRREILSRRVPLGEILIRRRVLTQVSPKWFLEFDRSSPQLAAIPDFESDRAYGRIGTIHLDGRPALHLLEIVTAAEGAESQKPLRA